MDKKIIFIIAKHNFRDEELLIPKKILHDSGFKIIIASSSLNTAVGLLGHKETPDLTIDKVNIHNYDCIIFVGGGGAREYFENETAHMLAREAQKSNITIGAICIAPVILAKAGILINKKATVFHSEINTLKNLEVLYSDENVVEEGNIITAKGPETASEFGNRIKNKLLNI